jgi:tight adherence protein C
MDAPTGDDPMRVPTWFGMAWFVGALTIAIVLRPRAVPRALPGLPVCSPLRLPSAAQLGDLRVRLLTHRRRRRALATSARELPDVVDLFALAIGSGLNLRLALVAVASRAPPSWVDPLTAVVARIERGIRVADAFDQLPAMTGEHAHPLVSALVSSERYGTHLLPSLERLAGEARLDRRRRAEEVARRVPVKLLFPLVLCILPAFGALTVAPLLAGALGSLSLG